MVALLVVAYDQAGAVGLAILGLARTVPTAVAVPLVGVIGARMPARRLLVLTYAARALTIGVAALAVPLHFTPVVLAMAGLDAVLGTLRRPVQAALLPFVTQSAGDLVAANVATSTGDGLAAFLGPLVGGAALVIAGPAPVLLLAALEFVVSAAFAAMIRASGETVGAATGSTLLALRDGAAAIAGHGIPRLVGVGFLVELLVTGALGVLLVPAATDLLHTGPAGVGTLYAAMGLGGLVGAAVAVIAIGPGRLVGTFLAALAGWGVPLVVLGSVGSAPIAAAMLAVCGAAAASLDVAGYSLLQRALPTRVRQQALALFEGVAQGALGLGGVLAPALIAWLGVAGAFVASGTALLAISIVLAPALLGHRAALARRTADVEQLRSLPLFEPLSLAVVEQLAAGVLHDGFAVFAQQPVDAIDPDHQRGDLRADIAERLVRQPDLIGDDSEQLLVFDAALDELDHRQAQAFEINLADAAGHAARRRAAEIGVMRDVAGKSNELAAVKRRRNGIKIHDVLAAAIRIVGDNDIAGRKFLGGKRLHQLAHGDLEAREQARRVVRLGDGRSGGIGDDAGDILDLGDERGAPGAHQGVAHLVRDLFERVADHLHGDGIGHARSGEVGA